MWSRRVDLEKEGKEKTSVARKTNLPVCLPGSPWLSDSPMMKAGLVCFSRTTLILVVLAAPHELWWRFRRCVVVVGWWLCLTRLILEIKSFQGDRQSDDMANTEELTTVTKQRHRNISTFFFHPRQKCCDVDVLDIVTTLWFGTTNNITRYACHSASVNSLRVHTRRCYFFWTPAANLCINEMRSSSIRRDSAAMLAALNSPLSSTSVCQHAHN